MKEKNGANESKGKKTPATLIRIDKINGAQMFPFLIHFQFRYQIYLFAFAFRDTLAERMSELSEWMTTTKEEEEKNVHRNKDGK